MKRFVKWLGLGLVTVLVLGAGFLYACGGELNSPQFWEREISAFEAADREAFPAPGLILFTGSSSIRLWSTLEADMAPLRVLNRGFGGAHMDHVLHFFDRLIPLYQARALVVYAGDNDIGAGKTAETVLADFQSLVRRVRETQPEIPIYFLTIKASRLRWSLWPEMARANGLIERLANADPLIHVIDVSTPMVELGQGAPPPKSLFAFDGLHLSEEGYALWTQIVRTRLLADLGEDPPR